MKWIGFFTFSISLLLLNACGGSNDGEPKIRPSGTVSGTAFDGLIINGKVSVYDFSNAEKGSLLGSATTDGSGLYSIDIVSDEAPIFLEVCGGRYIEEASGISVLLENGQCLYGVTNYISGEPVKMALTYFSTMATGYVECLIQDSNTPIGNLIVSANAIASNLAGYDITAVQPLDVSLSKNATAFVSNEIIAGMYAAGISQMMLDISSKNNQPPHKIYNSIYFSNLTYEDIKSDCLKNGIGENKSPLSMGIIPVTGDHYSYMQSKGMLEFINSNRNQTGLSIDSFENNIFRFNSVSDSTTTTLPTEIDQGTEITNFFPSNNTVVNNSITISAQLSDAIGILETRFLLNGNVIGTVPRSKSPSIELNTSQYGSGNFELTIEVTNDLFMKTAQTNSVTFSNAAPSITNFLPENGSKASKEITISADISSNLALSYISFLVGNVELETFDSPNNGNYSYQLNTELLTDGDHQLIIKAQDVTEQTAEQIRIITVDNSPPEVTNFVPLDNEILTGAYTIRAELSDASGINDATFLINGELLNGAGNLTNPTQTFDTDRYPDGFYTISIVVTDNLGLTRTVTRNVRISNTPMEFSIRTYQRGSLYRSEVAVNRALENIESFELIGEIRFPSRTRVITEAATILNSPESYAGSTFECYDRGSRSEFAKITVKVTDKLGVTGTKSWDESTRETCTGEKIRSL